MPLALHTEEVEELTEVCPKPYVETEGVKLSPTRPELGRLVMLGRPSGDAAAPGAVCN